MRRLRLVFIDDDKEELRKFRKIVKGNCLCRTIHWPHQSEELFKSPPPDVFVSDLYLPPRGGDTTPTAAEIEDAKRAARRVAKRFSSLYRGRSRNGKVLLRKTMEAITEAYTLLMKQWSGLGQSPEYGVELLRKLKARHPEVPFVFYSRKITPEDVVCVLQAGAFDAIRKGALEDKDVRTRLSNAREVFRREAILSLRARGFNANVTTMLAAQPR
jgi:DNA-binding NtrC family response regulator